MDDGDDRKLILEALVAEVSRLGDAIAERHAAAERFVSVAGGLAGVGLTLGLSQNQKPILIGLPIGLAIIILFMIQIYTDAGMHSGHRQALEVRLREQFGENVLVGQSLVAVEHARRPSVAWSSFLIIAVWVGTIALGWNAVWTWQLISGPSNGWYFWGYIALIAGAIVIIVQAVRENIAAERKANATAQTAWPTTPKT